MTPAAASAPVGGHSVCLSVRVSGKRHERVTVAQYAPAPEVSVLAQELIAEHHRHLDQVPILYVFRDVAGVSRGRRVIGRARRIVGLYAFLVALAAGEPAEDDEPDTPAFFVMEIAADWWDEATPAARRALVDHELCHFDVDEDGVLSLLAHDVEEFAAVVARHGIWSPDLEAFAGVCAASEG